MKWLLILGIIVVGVIIGFFALNNYVYQEKQAGNNIADSEYMSQDLKIIPVSHASMILELSGYTVYNDPVGGVGAYERYSKPDLILISDIHADHFDGETLKGLASDNTTIIMPQAVFDALSQDLKGDIRVLSNGDSTDFNGLGITALPAYNIPESDDAFHTKGRGNGYILEANSKRIYIAGDTGDTPEMKALENIDIAFIPMNLPYTMDVETAAEAVAEFSPRVVHPYHYRGPDGLSDVNKFKELVESSNPDVSVELLDFYPEE